VILLYKIVDDDIFIELYKDGLTFNEIASVFNVNPQTLTKYVSRYGLKRERTKPHHNRYGKSHYPNRLNAIKGTHLKKCLNPYCDYYYYGDKRDKYCCKKCRIKMHNIRNAEYIKKWRKQKNLTEG